MDGQRPESPALRDHDLRYALANELHARPFPTLSAPCQAAYLAIKRPSDAAARDRSADLAHLIDFLDRHGAPHPAPDATHWFGRIGRHDLKWEAHTEFVTYMLMGDGLAERPFDGSTFGAFPADWLAAAPGVRITSALIRVERYPGDDAIHSRLNDWFVPESLAISRVIDDAAVIAGDFRIDATGHLRFAVFARDSTGAQRVGRIVQRLCEIETYKSMSMLGLARAREIGPGLGHIDARLTDVMRVMGGTDRPAAVLKDLIEISAEIETLLATTSFRFGATGAYEAIVNQRIAVIREERFGGRQTFGEFMTRRFDPAMRTVKAAERRLQQMGERASRAADLLRTRVDVEMSAGNRDLLASMDRRADTQLQLQKTVEGLSVVAISYYAVSLVGYALGPLAEKAGIERYWFLAAATPVVVALVWAMIRRIRRAHFD